MRELLNRGRFEKGFRKRRPVSKIYQLKALAPLRMCNVIVQLSRATLATLLSLLRDSLSPPELRPRRCHAAPQPDPPLAPLTRYTGSFIILLLTINLYYPSNS